MKPLYKSPKVKNMLPFELKLVPLLLVLAVSICTSIQTFSQELVFKNPELDEGTAGQNGAVYRFPNVIAGVDALVEIKGRSSSSVVLESIDVPDEGWSKAFQPKLGRQGNLLGILDWWMEFEIRFVKTGTDQTANVSKFDITAIDIDGDGLTIKEYMEFYKAKSCAIESVSSLVSTFLGSGNNGNEKDYRLTGPLLNFLNIDTSGTSVMATAKFENKSSLKIRIGAKALGLGTSNAGMRFNSLWFRSFNYTAPRTLPVKLTSFDAAMINKKVALTWSTSMEKDASHFVVERSQDGVNFTDAGIIFTEGNSELSRSYSFKDPVSTSGKGILYYRLRIVDMDGQYEYSMIRLIKLGASDGKLELQAFPNPVVNDLRITIPEGWQNRQVVYELYTHDGQLLKRFIVKSANQTEVISMQQYQPGAYILKALNEKEIASQRIIKTR